MVWLCLRWWVVLCKSWAILVSRMLRKWWSLIRSVRNRNGVILLLYACVVYFDCEYCGCYLLFRSLWRGSWLVVILCVVHHTCLFSVTLCTASQCWFWRLVWGSCAAWSPLWVSCRTIISEMAFGCTVSLSFIWLSIFVSRYM